MMLHRIAAALLIVLAMSATWARDKVTPQTLLAKSDLVYYFPTAHGLTDLAVDVACDISALAANPLSKQMQVSYYYAGDTHERFVIANLPPSAERFRADMLAAISTTSQFIVPRTSADTFAGMKLTAKKVSRMLGNTRETSFYELLGVPMAAGAADTVQEYRVLLDKNGLLYQIENTLEDKSTVIANVENLKSDAGWHIATVTTRFMGNDGPRYRVERVEYATVAGFTLPVRYQAEYRDRYDHLVPELGTITLTFSNYRVNVGAGAAGLSTPAPATAP